MRLQEAKLNCAACCIYLFIFLVWSPHVSLSMCAAALSALFLPAADSPWGGVTLHLNVQEDVPIVLPNCGAVVPFKTRNLPICSTCDVKLTGLW